MTAFFSGISLLSFSILSLKINSCSRRKSVRGFCHSIWTVEDVTFEMEWLEASLSKSCFYNWNFKLSISACSEERLENWVLEAALANHCQVPWTDTTDLPLSSGFGKMVLPKKPRKVRPVQLITDGSSELMPTMTDNKCPNDVWSAQPADI